MTDTTPQRILQAARGHERNVVRFLRDPTRGGVSSALNELAAASLVGVKLFESALPIRREVRAACELLGLDPLFVANEGKLVAVVPQGSLKRALDILTCQPLGREACCIGRATEQYPSTVIARTIYGTERIVPIPSGELLPRIC